MSQVSVWSGHGGHRSQQKCGKFIKQRCPFPSSFFFFSLALLVQSKNKNVCVCVFLLNDKKHMNICCCFYCYTVVRLLCATLCWIFSVRLCPRELQGSSCAADSRAKAMFKKKTHTQRRLKCLCIVSVRDLTEVTLSWHADLGVGNLSKGPKNRQVWQTACVCLK